MSVINESCTNSEDVKNVGRKEQCQESSAKTMGLARDGFSFPDVATAKTNAAWKTAVANKDIIPFPNIEGIEANSTEAQYRNGRYRDYKLKDAVTGSAYRIDSSICTFEALKSYEDSEYTRTFTVTDEDEILCDVQPDGTVKGRKLTSYIVGMRNERTDADVAFNNVNLKYNSELFDVLKADFEVSDLEGIIDVTLEQVSASATSIKFKALDACTGDALKVFEDGDIVVKDTTGATETISFVAPDADGVYEVTGTDFATDYTVELNGVVTKVNDLFETPVALKITVS